MQNPEITEIAKKLDREAEERRESRTHTRIVFESFDPNEKDVDPTQFSDFERYSFLYD